jgi:hypothetical protein
MSLSGANKVERAGGYLCRRGRVAERRTSPLPQECALGYLRLISRCRLTRHSRLGRKRAGELTRQYALPSRMLDRNLPPDLNDLKNPMLCGTVQIWSGSMHGSKTNTNLRAR